MKKINLLVLLLIIFLGNSIAQDVYYTRDANLQVHGEFNGKSLHGSTRELGITLDYETTKIILRLNLKNLSFDSDSFNTVVPASHSELEFNGTLSLEYINTEDHPPQIFTIDGWVEINNEKKRIRGKGELHHIDQSGNFACMLGMTIELKLDDFNIKIPGLGNELKVLITQALLKRDGN